VKLQKSEVGFQKPEVEFRKSWLESRKSEVAPQASRFKLRRRATAPWRSNRRAALQGPPPRASTEHRDGKGATARRRAFLQSAAAGRAKQHAAVRFCRAPQQPGQNSTPPCASAETEHRHSSQGATATAAGRQAPRPSVMHAATATAFKQKHLLLTFIEAGLA
jgi:hypothetical protein